MAKLEERKRRELVNQSKSNPRFKRRLKCKLPANSSAYENIDMNKLFKEDILEAKINVIGETDTYEIIVSFQDVLAELKEIIKEKGPNIKLNMILRAVIRAFDRNDVYIHCSCPDFKYRFNYWATIERYNSGDPELRPTDQTNPDGQLGSCCKHVLLILNKQVWIIKVASVINNYIRYMKKRNQRLYDKFIAPAIFVEPEEQEIEEPESNEDERQLTLFDDNPEDEETNEIAKDRKGDEELEAEEEIDDETDA